MQKELLNENRSRIWLAVLSLLALLALAAGVYALVRLQTAHNDREIEAALTTLAYTEDTAEVELAGLEQLTDTWPISVPVRGRLYRAMAEVSYMTGDDMVYNRYVAYALHYLQSAGDEDGCAYLTNKYIGRLYANGCYETAIALLDELAESVRLSDLTLSLQASYYLSYADLQQMLGRDPEAALVKGEAAIRLMPEEGERGLQQAKLDVLRARGAIDDGNFERAQILLADYAETDDFGLGLNQVYVVCDYRIPYHELMTKLALQNADEAALAYHMERYLAYCDAYHFRAMKLNLLRYLVAHSDPANEEARRPYEMLMEDVSRQNLTEMTDEYGQFLLADIHATTEKLTALDREKASGLERMLQALVALYAVILLYSVGSIAVDYLGKDGLTRLNGRRKYEHARVVCERKRIPYCLLMLDIDDFKHVNDTYGHARGDAVLRQIADILRSYTGRGIFAYRYGGEELCVMLLRVPEKRSREIAEEIRRTVEEQTSVDDTRVTVSIGVGVSVAGENVFQQADHQLYAAKGSGKNCVC